MARMRELLNDLIQSDPPDPMQAARRNMRPSLRKRFYNDATAGPEGPEGFPVLLDGRPVRTPARRLLAAPAAALAEAVAAEWHAQLSEVDPGRMPLTRLANTILDGVDADREAVIAEVAKYLGSDLLFYRADGPAGLVARQSEHWDPVLEWARDTLGARFILAEGVTYVAQPERAVAAASAAIPTDPWRLGAVVSATALTGSALLALALARGRLVAEQAWAAAHVDEDWNLEQWGRDEMALQRRAFRWEEMRAAAEVLRLAARNDKSKTR
jgi:chaperone required for assembly of F1-ATPase